jgi:chaperonin GroES
MTLRPLHDRIVVERQELSEQRVGGIIVPDSAREKPQQGTVIAVGLGKRNDNGDRVALDVAPGDTILFGKYSGQDITLDGVTYLIMKEDDVLAISDRASAGGR